MYRQNPKAENKQDLSAALQTSESEFLIPWVTMRVWLLKPLKLLDQTLKTIDCLHAATTTKQSHQRVIKKGANNVTE